MEKILKRSFVFLFMLIAVAAWSAPKAEAATVTSKSPVSTDTSHWSVTANGYLKVSIPGLPTGECFLKLSGNKYPHYLLNIGGKKYKLVAGQHYVKNGVLLPVSSNTNLALPLYETDPSLKKAKTSKVVARTVYHIIPQKTASGGYRGANFEGYSTSDGYGPTSFYYGQGSESYTDGNGNKGTGSCNTYNNEDGVIVVLPNSGDAFTGLSDNNLLCNKGSLYSGYTLKDGKMHKVTSGKLAASGYTGSVSKYFNYVAKTEKSQAATAYKNGILANGWVLSGSLTYGYYKNGILDQSLNYWCKNKSNGKWYYFEKGRIYRTGKKGPAKKKLKTIRLNYWGHGKASPGSYRYYLNADGSLVTNVFAVDSSWYKKKMRIYVNAKSGIDNVTFMGYIKGSGFCVPLKTIVTTCSKKEKTLKKQVRGAKGKGKWKLGRKGGSRHRWYLFHKEGHTYYYQYATSILGSGALFHSPRFLRHSIRSLYKPHFNAMGKKNITTKCVRIQVANALMVYNISKACKSYNYVSFIRKGRTKKTAYLPFGITELEDAIGQKTWGKNYDPSDPGIK